MARRPGGIDAGRVSVRRRECAAVLAILVRRFCVARHADSGARRRQPHRRRNGQDADCGVPRQRASSRTAPRRPSCCAATATTSRSCIARSTRMCASWCRQTESREWSEAHRAGCDVVVLDDAFQHRRVRRVADVVLVSADATGTNGDTFSRPARGASRALSGAARVTRDHHAEGRSTRSGQRRGRRRHAGNRCSQRDHSPCRRISAPDERKCNRRHRCDSRGSVLAISGIGDPNAFHAQLAAHGARVVAETFRDHHRFTPTEATRLARQSKSLRPRGLHAEGRGEAGAVVAGARRRCGMFPSALTSKLAVTPWTLC